MAVTQDFKTNISIPEIKPAPDENASWDELFALCKQQNDTIIELSRQIANLSESVAYLTRKLYGASREKLPFSGQIDLFGNIWGGGQPDPLLKNPEPPKLPKEILADSTTGEKSEKKTRSKRKDLFSDMKTEKVLIPLSEEELTCKICGSKMEIIGEEQVREEFKITPMEISRVQYFRQTAACANCKEEYGSFAYASSEAPPALIDHSMASPSSVAYIAHQKITNAMTFYRMEKEMETRGVPLGRETMASWIIYCALNILEPLYLLMLSDALGRPVLHGDETWCQVLHEEGRPATAKSYIFQILELIIHQFASILYFRAFH